MRKYDRFIDLDRDIDTLYEQERYQEGLDTFIKALNELPKNEIEENFFTIIWNKAVLYTKCDKYDECFELIKDTVDNGYAFPIHFKRFESIMNRLEKSGIVQKNKVLLEKINKDAKPEYEVHLPKDYNPLKKYPLFIGLHGDGMCSIKEFSGYWKPEVFLDHGYIFAYIQSSQTICYNGYGWLRDIETSRMDIELCYKDIAQMYLIDEEKIDIGGYSGGAIAALDFTMSHILPINGFICLCPEEKTDAFKTENVEFASEQGIKGVFMEGELMLPMKAEDEMMNEFDKAGLPYEYYINKGIGHSVPANFDEKLIRALKFIS